MLFEIACTVTNGNDRLRKGKLRDFDIYDVFRQLMVVPDVTLHGDLLELC